ALSRTRLFYSIKQDACALVFCSQSIFALTHGGLSVKEITNFLKSTTDVQSLLDGIDAKMKEQLVAVLSGSGRSLFTSIISEDRKSTRLNSSHVSNSYAVFFLIK